MDNYDDEDMRTDIEVYPDAILRVCSYHRRDFDLVTVRSRPHDMHVVESSLRSMSWSPSTGWKVFEACYAPTLRKNSPFAISTELSQRRTARIAQLSEATCSSSLQSDVVSTVSSQRRVTVPSLSLLSQRSRIYLQIDSDALRSQFYRLFLASTA